MNEFNIYPDMTWHDLKTQFTQVFPHLKLDLPGPTAQPVTDPQHATRPGRLVACPALRISDTTSVADFERTLQNRFGLRARVSRRMGYTWHDTDSTRHWTLARQNRKGAEVSQFRGVWTVLLVGLLLLLLPPLGKGQPRSALAKPDWIFTVRVAVEQQTATYFEQTQGRPIAQLVREQLATVSSHFNSDPNFNGIYTFRVDSVYVFSGSASSEVFRTHPGYTYSVVIDGFASSSAGGGWYGSYQTIYHKWPWNFFGGPFASTATDGLTHEFAHARGAVDIYAMRVEGSSNPVNNTGFEPVNSIMNYPYGNIVWDEYTTNLLNSTQDGPIVGETWITTPFPRQMGIKAVDHLGIPIENVSLDLYPVNWFSYAVTPTPILNTTTGMDGAYRFLTNPYQPGSNGYPWTMRYANFLLRATHNSVVTYAWMPLYDAQNAYFRNGPDTLYNTVVQFPASTPILRLASLNGTQFCPDGRIDVSVTVSEGVFQPGNAFTLQLSDAAGSFSNGLNISIVSGKESLTLSGYFASLPPGTAYKVRVISTMPVARSNDLPVTIKPTPPPPMVSGSVSVCQYDPPPVLAATGQNLRWYGPGGVLLPAAPTVNTDQVGGQFYRVTQTIDGCESPNSSIYVNIQALQSVRSGSWDDPTIWSCGRVPRQTDTPIISAGHSVSVTGAEAAAKRVTFRSGAKLVIPAGGQLRLSPN